MTFSNCSKPEGNFWSTELSHFDLTQFLVYLRAELNTVKSTIALPLEKIWVIRSRVLLTLSSSLL